MDPHHNKRGCWYQQHGGEFLLPLYEHYYHRYPIQHIYCEILIQWNMRMCLLFGFKVAKTATFQLSSYYWRGKPLCDPPGGNAGTDGHPTQLESSTMPQTIWILSSHEIIAHIQWDSILQQWFEVNDLNWWTTEDPLWNTRNYWNNWNPHSHFQNVHSNDKLYEIARGDRCDKCTKGMDYAERLTTHHNRGLKTERNEHTARRWRLVITYTFWTEIKTKYIK